MTAKVNYKPTQTDLNHVREWCYDHDQLKNRIQSVCRSISAPFLRRHISPKHTQVYVSRNIDKIIKDLSKHLMPSALTEDRRIKKRKKRVSTETEIEYETYRELPYQICILRDVSGSGKTTFAIQNAFSIDPHFGISRSASEVDIDLTFSFFKKFGPNKGINELIELNKPLVVVIDSLDEAMYIAGKRSEIISLNRYLKELNEEAQQHGLLTFPLLLVYTVREDFWDEWQSVFEGVKSKHYRNHFSKFSEPEFNSALDKYSSAYQYVYLSYPAGNAIESLSVPFNMHVYSEANEFSEQVSFQDIFDEKVLQLYFIRKSENVIKRQITGIINETFYRLGSEMAMAALRRKSRSLTRKDFYQIIRKYFPSLHAQSDHLLLSILSEGVVTRDPANLANLRFRHSRFMEYLIAHFIIKAYEEGFDTIDNIINFVFETGILSMFRIHDFIRFICKQEYPDMFEPIMDLYAQSTRYMSRKLINLRSSLGVGVPPTDDDIKIIMKSTSTADPQVAWDAFFTIAAKPTNADKVTIFKMFKVAWKANGSNPNRWKLIDRLASRGFLLDGNVLECILESNFERDWECFLGDLLNSTNLRRSWKNNFLDFQKRMDESLQRRTGKEWQHVYKLWNTLLEGADYIPGDI